MKFNSEEVKLGFIDIYRRWGRIKARLFVFLVRRSFYKLGRNSVLVLPVRLGGESRISIGSGVYIGANSWLQAVSAVKNGGDPVIQIGDGVAMSGYCTVTAVDSVIIEAKVLLARYVYISDHTHAHDRMDVAVMDQGITKISPVRIRAGAWLGQNVVICPGVTIGRNAVIGANSVVRDDIPDYAVAVGAPARVIRMIDGGRSQ